MIIWREKGFAKSLMNSIQLMCCVKQQDRIRPTSWDESRLNESRRPATVSASSLHTTHRLSLPETRRASGIANRCSEEPANTI